MSKKKQVVREGEPFYFITSNGTHLQVVIENIFGSYRVGLKDDGPEEEDGPWAEGYNARKGR